MTRHRVWVRILCSPSPHTLPHHHRLKTLVHPQHRAPTPSTGASLRHRFFQEYPQESLTNLSLPLKFSSLMPHRPIKNLWVQPQSDIGYSSRKNPCNMCSYFNFSSGRLMAIGVDLTIYREGVVGYKSPQKIWVVHSYFNKLFLHRKHMLVPTQLVEFLGLFSRLIPWYNHQHSKFHGNLN